MELNPIVEHCRHPYHLGACFAATHEQQIVHPSCGDEVTIYLRIHNSIAEEAWFRASGCMVSRAGASMLCEYIEDRTVEDLLALNHDGFLEHFGVELTPHRKLCFLLPLEALKLILRMINESRSD